MGADEAKSDEDPVEITLFGRDLNDVRRILTRISRAADRRAVLDSARSKRAAPHESPEDDQDPREMLALQIFNASQARGRFLSKEVDDLTWNVLLLAYLAAKAGARHSIGRFVEIAQCSHSTALRRIDSLEEMGLATREQDPADRRILHLVLSEEGRKAVEQVLSYALERNGP